MEWLRVSVQKIEELVRQFGSPIYLYDEAGIRETAQALKRAFAWSPGYRNFFAVKALPIPGVLQILAEEGMGMDCSSLLELQLVTDPEWGLELPGDRIMLTSNNTDEDLYRKAMEKGVFINIDAFEHIKEFLTRFGVPESICFRYNPEDRVKGNAIIGESDSVKYGLPHDKILEAYRIMKEAGVKRFGLHAMLVSNELSIPKLVENARIIFLMAAEAHERYGINFDFVNLGGGIGTAYRPTDKAVDLDELGGRIRECYEGIFSPLSMSPTIFTECGRVVTGPNGYLIARVKHEKELKRRFLGVDTSVADILRPGMYSSAYHPIAVLHSQANPELRTYDVVGSLCENLKLAEQRLLPIPEKGDIVVIGFAGAHCRAMAMNYNGWHRSGGVLLRQDGSLVRVQRSENYDDMVASYRDL